MQRLLSLLDGDTNSSSTASGPERAPSLLDIKPDVAVATPLPQKLPWHGMTEPMCDSGSHERLNGRFGGAGSAVAVPVLHAAVASAHGVCIAGDASPVRRPYAA